jgi:hypothetical protein
MRERLKDEIPERMKVKSEITEFVWESRTHVCYRTFFFYSNHTSILNFRSQNTMHCLADVAITPVRGNKPIHLFQ